MPLVLPRFVNCVEYRTKLAGGHTVPCLVQAEHLDTGVKVEVALKFRDPGVRGGHAGATSLAIELICCMVARALGLDVPDYFVATVSTAFAASIPDGEVGRRAAANIGQNFGTEYLNDVYEWNPRNKPTDPGLLTSIEDVMAFDLAMINGDRWGQKPNLLTSTRNAILIDHSLALPVHDQVVPASYVMPDSYILRHCCAAALMGKGRFFQVLYERWNTVVTPEFLAQVRAAIPIGWESRSGDLDRVFAFLGARSAHLGSLSDALRSALR